MNSITLRHINRVGFDNWKAREWWMGQRVHIWSKEHFAYWRPNAAGYTVMPNEAGVWEFPDAYDQVKHCGPEKEILFYAVVGAGQRPLGTEE